MAIIRKGETPQVVRRIRDWDPFQTMRDFLSWEPFQEMLPRLSRIGEERQGMAPDFDVRETQDAYLFKADVPGFREQDVDVKVIGRRLTVSGKREADRAADTDSYYCRERSYGSFSRSFTLPEDLNPDQVDAEMKDGVLTIRFPKIALSQPKRISIRGASERERAKA